MEIWLYRILITAGIGFIIWLAQKLIKKVEELNGTVNKLNGILIEQASNQRNFKHNCQAREKFVDKKFERLESQVDDHEQRLQKFES